MGVLIVDYSDLKSTISTSKSACRNIENYADSLDKKVTQKISDLGFSTSRTSDANWFARKKTENLRKKAEKYTNFAKKLENFGEVVQEKDKAVSNKFDTLYSTFKTNNNIKVNPVKEFFVNLTVGISNSSSLSRWVKNTYNNIKTYAKGVYNSIKEWFKYKGGKFVWDIFKSVVSIAAGIALICFTPLGIVGGFLILGYIFSIINDVTNIGNSIKAYKYGNSDPAMAARYGRIDTFSDWLRKTVFKSDSLNRNSFDIADNYDRIKFVVDTVGLVGSFSSFFQNSKNISSIKNLFAGPEGLKVKFLEKTGSSYTITAKSFLNGFKSIKNDKTFWSNLIKNLQKDFKSDKFTLIRNFKDKKININYVKDVIINSVKGNSVDKAISREIIEGFGNDLIKINIPNLIKDVFKPNSNYGESNAIFDNIIVTRSINNFIKGIELIETTSKIDKINLEDGLDMSELYSMIEIFKLDEINFIKGLDVSNLSSIKDFIDEIKKLYEKNDYLDKYGPISNKS